MDINVKKEIIQIPPAIDRFYDNTIGLSEYLMDLMNRMAKKGVKKVPPEVITLAMGYIEKNYTRMQVIEGFINKTYPHWESILSNKESEIAQNVTMIFGSLPMQIVKQFEELFLMKGSDGNFIVGTKDRNIIFTYFHSDIKIAINHIHDMRQPYSIIVEGKESLKYNKKYFTGELSGLYPKYPDFCNINIDIGSFWNFAKKCGLNLTFPRKVLPPYPPSPNKFSEVLSGDKSSEISKDGVSPNKSSEVSKDGVSADGSVDKIQK